MDNSCDMAMANTDSMPKEEMKGFEVSCVELKNEVECQEKLIELLNKQFKPIMRTIPDSKCDTSDLGDSNRDERSEFTIRIDSLTFRMRESNDRLRRIMELSEI
jgi:hypothetical protein